MADLAVDLLTKIKSETTKQNEILTQSITTDKDLQKTLINFQLDQAKKSDAEQRYAELQAGINLQFDKIQQHRLENIDVDLDEPREGAMGTKETDEPVGRKIDEATKMRHEAEEENINALDRLYEITKSYLGETAGAWAKNLKSSIEGNAQISKLSGAIKTDFQISPTR